MNSTCEHNYITSTFEKGWHCCDCGVQLLSLSVPIPLPLVAKALDVLATGSAPQQAEQGRSE